MELTRYLMAVALVAFMLAVVSSHAKTDKFVVAHRGASGYLPENSMATAATAFAFKSDFIEMDLVMTADDHLLVFHDLFLDEITDVRRKFDKNRKRKDGRYYVIDFTLAEVKKLKVYERFPGRFPQDKSNFRVATFSEYVELIQGLQTSTGYQIGINVDIKDVAFHRKHGKDISLAALQALKSYGYSSLKDNVFVSLAYPSERNTPTLSHHTSII